jgi:hypothetical protein
MKRFCLAIAILVPLASGRASAQSTIPVEFTAPVSGAFIEDIYPITLTNPEYPSFLVLWGVGSGTEAVPIQILDYASSLAAYADDTASVISGPIPSILNPRNAAVAPLNDSGLDSVVIANQGLDESPWPGTTDTLLLATPSGQLVDESALLPQRPAYTHDVSAGVIGHAGHVGIFFNNIYSEPDTPPKFVVDDMQGDFVKSPSRLPAALHSTYPTYTSSALVDVNGDGLADLVLGPEDNLVKTPRVFLNPGGGHFELATKIKLPVSPLPATAGLYSTELAGPVTLDIRPIHLSSPNYADLVVVSTTASYSGYAIQILINDGTGHFTDQTQALIPGVATSAVSGTDTAYWVKRAWVFDHGGTEDIVTESAGDLTAPSQVFANDGTGHFTLAASMTGISIANVAVIGGAPTLIETNYQTIALAPYP